MNIDISSQQEARDLAEQRGLDIIQLNTDGNDYPRGLGDYAAIGFDTYEDAEAFAEEIGSDVCLFQTRDGHTFWRNNGRKYEALTADDYLNDLGDNFHAWTPDMLDSDADVVRDLVADDELEKAAKKIADLQKLRDEYDEAEADEIIICGEGRYMETVKATMMKYYEDVHTYAVGVLIGTDLNSDDETDQ